MSDGREAVKARIRALLNKTVARGCTEAEALAAAEKAFALLRAHGLTEAELHVGRAAAPLGRTRRQPLDDLWGTVASVCRCRAVLVGGGVGWGGAGNPLAVRYIGPLPWPEVAAWLQGMLAAAHERAMTAFRRSAEYLRRRKPRTRALSRRQFTVGFVEGVRRKLYALVAPDWSAIKRDLSMVDRVAADELGGRTLANLGQASNARDVARDRAAGQRAGDGTNVSWGVTSSAPRALASPARPPARRTVQQLDLFGGD